MPHARNIEGTSVFLAPRRRHGKAKKGGTGDSGARPMIRKRLGVVEHVLFHPKRPHAVGIEVRRAAWLYVIQRPPAFVPLEEVELADGELTLRSRRPVKDRAAEKRQGFEWAKTVIWVGMPVVTRSGKSAGDVRDVQFRMASGEVRRLYLTGGMAADLAVGTKNIEGGAVVGFDGQSVVIEDAVEQMEYSGGVARHAGRGAAVAKVGAERAARGAVAAGRAGAKIAAESEVGKRAMRGLKALTQVAKDALRDKKEP